MPISAQIRQLEPAFISPNMISMDASPMDGIVTASRWTDSSLIIMIRPVEPLPALASLRITIDERDLAEVQKLLGEERSQLVPADDEGVVPDDDVVAAQLAKALRTLRIIADMEETKQEPEDSWRETLFRTIELAQHTLDWIEIDAGQSENDNATPSDS